RVSVDLATAGHLKSVETIHKALASSPRAAQKPAHWIQISGASALAAGEVADKARGPGEASDLVFNDLAGIAELRSFIRGHPGRGVDNYVIEVAADEPKVNTALVFPPIIYGRGTGPVNRRSVQIPSLAKATLDRRRGVQVGRGLSRWGNVHVQDVSRLIFRLVEKAAEAKGEEQVWNSNGLYLTGVGEIPFGEISNLVAAAAADQGLIPTSEVDAVGPDEANSLLPHGAVLYGTNARSEALRGKEVLGWAPAGESLEDEIPRAVAEEEEASAGERSSLSAHTLLIAWKYLAASDRGYYYVSPTVFADVHGDMRIWREEIFGPVVVVVVVVVRKFGEEAEAIKVADDGVYGSGAAVFTTDLERGAHRVCRRDRVRH
ncbi:Betaine aldehyde dehydrogenase, partial [Colletotrichum shisoi]